MAKTPPPTPENIPPAPAGPSFMGKIVAAIVIGIIVAGEAGLVYFFLPNADAIASRVREEVKQELNDGDEKLEDVAQASEFTEQAEVELGSFTLAIHQPSTNSTLNVTCRVMGTIEKLDQVDFDKLLANNANRLRERIIIEFRSAELDELTDAGLGLLKRRILEKSNQLLGKPILKSIMFPEYNYYQQ
jgi:flagellar FliL protein